MPFALTSCFFLSRGLITLVNTGFNTNIYLPTMKLSNIKAHPPYLSSFYEEIDGLSYNSENLNKPPVRPHRINTKDTLDTTKTKYSIRETILKKC
jgi:hypothetical protein